MIALQLPKLGSTMDEGTIVTWRVKDGDEVDAGEVLYEVTTDKVNMEVEADRSLKVVQILVHDGQTVRVGTDVAMIEGNQMTTASRSDDGLHPVERDVNRKVGQTGYRASPAARRLATMLGVRVDHIKGTGPRGRVTPADVQHYTRLQHAKPMEQRESAPPIDENVGRSSQALIGTRAVIAERMTQSAKIPQVTLTMSVDMSAVMSLRASWKDAGIDRTIVDLIFLSTARMLSETPQLNGWVQNGRFIPGATVDLGYAVDVPNRGLFVVTIPNVDRMRLDEIAQGRRIRVNRVLAGSANLKDLGSPTFTVSNLGPLGVETFNPLLMPPQVGILGLGALVGSHDAPRMHLCLTFDHRAIDGAPAAMALRRLRQLLERPGLLL